MFSYDYAVTFVFEHCNITVGVVTDVKDDDAAIAAAEQTIAYDGVEYPEPREVSAELCGVYGGMSEED